jgi:hypothetical protein
MQAQADTTSLDIAIKQYEEAIAFELAHPWDGSQTPRAIPYCFIPDRVKSRIEDGRADYLREVQKLLASAKRSRAAVR